MIKSFINWLLNPEIKIRRIKVDGRQAMKVLVKGFSDADAVMIMLTSVKRGSEKLTREHKGHKCDVERSMQLLESKLNQIDIDSFFEQWGITSKSIKTK